MAPAVLREAFLQALLKQAPGIQVTGGPRMGL